MLSMWAATVGSTNRKSHLLNDSLFHPLMRNVYVRVEGQVVGSICTVLQLPLWSYALSETFIEAASCRH